MIFFSRLEFVPGKRPWSVGWLYRCAAVLLYRDPRSMPPNTVRTSSQHSTPAHLVWLFFFKQKTAYEIMPSLVGSEMCIRDRRYSQPTDHGLLPRLHFFARSFEPVQIRAGRRKSLPPSILRNFRFFFRFSER